MSTWMATTWISELILTLFPLTYYVSLSYLASLGQLLLFLTPTLLDFWGLGDLLVFLFFTLSRTDQDCWLSRYMDYPKNKLWHFFNKKKSKSTGQGLGSPKGSGRVGSSSVCDGEPGHRTDNYWNKWGV